jgi:hypothetical protein
MQALVVCDVNPEAVVRPAKITLANLAYNMRPLVWMEAAATSP